MEYFERRHKKEGLTLRGLFEELDEKGDQIVSPEAFIRRMIRHGVKIARAEMLELLRALDPNDEGVLFFGPFSRSLRRNRQALRQKRYEEVHGTGADHLPPTAQATMLKRAFKTGAWTQDWRRDEGVVVGGVVVEPPLRALRRVTSKHSERSSSSSSSSSSSNGGAFGGGGESGGGDGNHHHHDYSSSGEEVSEGQHITSNQLRHHTAREERRSSRGRSELSAAAKRPSTTKEKAARKEKKKKKKPPKPITEEMRRAEAAAASGRYEMVDSGNGDRKGLSFTVGSMSRHGFQTDGLEKAGGLVGLEARQELPAKARMRREHVKEHHQPRKGRVAYM